MQNHILTTQELFAPGHTRAWAHLSGYEYPWEILAEIKDIIREEPLAQSSPMRRDR